jgi:hypothetical protein
MMRTNVGYTTEKKANQALDDYLINRAPSCSMYSCTVKPIGQTNVSQSIRYRPLPSSSSAAAASSMQQS